MDSKVKQLICPIDGKPCEKDCPDRYRDTPNGGCILTTAQELGAHLLQLNSEYTAIVFTPEGG